MAVRRGGGLAQDAVSAALAYRAQAPVIDGLMKELGLDGGSLDALVKGAAAAGGGSDEAARPVPGLTKSVPSVRFQPVTTVEDADR